MIFWSPPVDPWAVISGETEFIVWTVSENTKKENSFDRRCISVAQNFENKTFIRLRLGFCKTFQESHHLKKAKTSIRCNRNEIFWKCHNPSANDLHRQGTVLGKRRGHSNFEFVTRGDTNKPSESSNTAKTNTGEFKRSKSVIRNRIPRLFKRNTEQKSPSLPREINSKLKTNSLKTNCDITDGELTVSKLMQMQGGSKSSIISEDSNMSLMSKLPNRRASTLSRVKKRASKLARRVSLRSVRRSTHSSNVEKIDIESVSLTHRSVSRNRSRSSSCNTEDKFIYAKFSPPAEERKSTESSERCISPINRRSQASILSVEPTLPNVSLSSLVWFGNNFGKNSARMSIYENCDRLSEYIKNVQISKSVSNLSLDNNDATKSISKGSFKCLETKYRKSNTSLISRNENNNRTNLSVLNIDENKHQESSSIIPVETQKLWRNSFFDIEFPMNNRSIYLPNKSNRLSTINLCKSIQEEIPSVSNVSTLRRSSDSSIHEYSIRKSDGEES